MNSISSCSLLIKVTPNSHKDICTSLEGNVLKVRLRALPQDGAANTSLLVFLSKILGIPKSLLSLRKGKTSRLKEVFIQSLSLEEVQKKITPYLL